MDQAFEMLKSDDQTVALRNVATFLIAVDSIFIKSMQKVGNLNQKRTFGYMIDGKFYFENEISGYQCKSGCKIEEFGVLCC